MEEAETQQKKVEEEGKRMRTAPETGRESCLQFPGSSIAMHAQKCPAPRRQARKCWSSSPQRVRASFNKCNGSSSHIAFAVRARRTPCKHAGSCVGVPGLCSYRGFEASPCRLSCVLFDPTTVCLLDQHDAMFQGLNILWATTAVYSGAWHFAEFVCDQISSVCRTCSVS